ncbi:hypothetical protein I010019E5_07720 [Bifidobacterium adolescentis]|uniref:MFS transporter n=1 Tax=Bifidobacterium adolescentis TaxID=1680 RepID=UPI0036F1C3AF
MKTADKTRETPAFPKTFIMAMIFGVGLNPVNSTLISTALAPISHDLRIDAGRATLLISALYLTCAIAQPTAGKLSEIIGPRSVFMAGAALVMIGGLLGGFAPNLGVLLTSRVLIGAGTSCGYPAAMLLVRRRADRMGLAEPPSLVLSILAMVGLVLIAVGPPLGGLLVTFLGWRSTFFVNVLVGIITIVLGLASIEPDAKHEHRMTVSFFIAHLDVTGLLLFSITISALLIVLMSLPTFDKVSGCVTVIALLAFVAWELHAATPFVDVRSLAADSAMTLNFLRAMLTMLGAYVVMYALPQWLEDACHMNAGVSGMFIIPMGGGGDSGFVIHREEADSAPAVDGVLFGDGGGGHVVGLHVIRWHGRIAVDRLRCRGTGVGTQHVDQSDRAISPSGIRAYWHVVWSAAHVHLYRVYRCVLIEWRVLR